MEDVFKKSKIPTKRDYKHPSLDEQFKKNKVLRRKDTINRFIECLGKKFRSIVEVLDPDQIKRPQPTNNREINRRAGKTAIAAIVTIGAITAGAFYLENNLDEECKTTEASGFDVGQASESKIYSDVGDTNYIEICEPQLSVIDN